MNITEENKETRIGIIDTLKERNGYHYNLHKASEEFQELALVLTQKLLKPTKVDDQEIIDEIGDCIIRLDILKKMFDNKKIEDKNQIRKELLVNLDNTIERFAMQGIFE